MIIMQRSVRCVSQDRRRRGPRAAERFFGLVQPLGRVERRLARYQEVCEAEAAKNRAQMALQEAKEGDGEDDGTKTSHAAEASQAATAEAVTDVPRSSQACVFYFCLVLLTQSVQILQLNFLSMNTSFVSCDVVPFLIIWLTFQLTFRLLVELVMS